MLVFQWYATVLNVLIKKGYPGLNASFSAMFGWPSKLLLILLRILGRHRGIKKSVRDQEDEVHDEFMKKLVIDQNQNHITTIQLANV